MAKKKKRRNKGQAAKSGAQNAVETTSTAQTRVATDAVTPNTTESKSTEKSRTQSGFFSKFRGVKTSRRQLALMGIAFVVAITGMASLHAFDKRNRDLHDLSVIGNGVPVIVQIHDPSCPTCRQLKSRMNAAMKDLPDVEYRLADISTSQGRTFQSENGGLPKITLMFFNAKGDHRHTLQGLVSPEEIKAAASRYFRRSAASANS